MRKWSKTVYSKTDFMKTVVPFVVFLSGEKNVNTGGSSIAKIFGVLLWHSCPGWSSVILIALSTILDQSMQPS